MSTEITALESAGIEVYPYLMRYQITGYKKDTNHFDFYFDPGTRSPSLASFFEIPVKLKFRRQYYVSGYYGGDFPCLEIKTPHWPNRHQLRYPRCFASAIFDFRQSGASNGSFPTAAAQTVQPGAEMASDLPSGFSIYLKKTGISELIDYPDDFFDDNTIIFAYWNAHCSGNVPPHLHPIYH
jgi:hypothetical protein